MAGNESKYPFIVTRTPFRISLAGGGTDLEAYYKYHSFGAVLSFAIDKFVYVTLKRHGEIFNEFIRLNYSEVELVQDTDDIKNDIARGCLQHFGINKPSYVSTISDIPAASRLGSSSSFAVGFLNALHLAHGRTCPTGQLAEEACFVEIEKLRKPIGKQDAYPAAFGGMNFVRFEDSGHATVQPITPKDGDWSNFSSHLMLFWTGITRESSTILAEQSDNSRNSDTAAKLTAMREHAVLLSTHMQGQINPAYVGEILRDGWELKQQLSSGVTSGPIDHAYARAMAAGALGGKLCGAGGGGFLLFVVPSDRRQAVRNALQELRTLDINVENAGSRVLYPVI